MKTKTRVYQLATYDVWGNAREGFEVNNVYQHGEIKIKCKGSVYNQGTEWEFTEWAPTDLQCNRAVGARNCQSVQGEPDYVLYFENKMNGKPVYELRFLRFE